FELSDEERARGTALVRLAACLQFFFPGSPCIYYGDEAGVEGFEDPFNRTFYPWNREDTALREYYRKLGKLKRAHKEMQSGVLRVLFAEGDVIVLSRTHGEDEVIAAVNRGDSERTVFIRNPHNYVDVITNKSYKSRLGILLLRIPGRDNCVLTKMQ
ncbi:MAG: alpha-amylase family glycosyl hydrolase, partial [Clostridia bacterium]